MSDGNLTYVLTKNWLSLFPKMLNHFFDICRVAFDRFTTYHVQDHIQEGGGGGCLVTYW